VPLKVDKRDKKVFALLACVVLLLVVIAALLKPSGDDDQAFPSSYSTAKGGAKAAYELLQALGIPAERWSGTPETLPANSQKYVLVLAEPSAVNPKEAAAIRKFVSGGGRVLVTGNWASVLFTQLRIVSAPIGKDSWRSYHALFPSDVSRGASEITMRERFSMVSRPGQAIFGDNDYSAVVVQYPYGSGEVIWWADTVPLSNAGIQKRGNMELLLNTLGNGSRTVLWDEYFHGTAASLWSYMKGTPVTWGILQLGILFTAVLFTYSRRHGPIFVPIEPSRMSPLEFVENLGFLYERARGAQISVDVALRTFRLKMNRFGLSPNASLNEIANTIAARSTVRGTDVLETLKACESALSNSKLKSFEALRLVRLLHSYSQQLDDLSLKKEKP
jgi:hypothetical protein